MAKKCRGKKSKGVYPKTAGSMGEFRQLVKKAKL